MSARFAASRLWSHIIAASRTCGFLRWRAAALVLCGMLAMPLATPPGSADAQSAKLETAYVVLGADGAIARAILSDATECPMIDIGGAAERMSIRARPDAAFPVHVCETPIPPGTTSAAIEGRVLPLPKPAIATIATFGDTGCRLKAGGDVGKSRRHHDYPAAGEFQDCDSSSQWPFARLSAAVAAQKPDLVIHVGDYIYRESPCPAGDQSCKGSPFGDDWRTWQVDFFQPAAPLLAAASWIMVRGNHESCARAGLGYFRFLYPEPARDHAPPTCTNLLAPYTVDLGGKAFLVIDSSNAEDACPNNACDSAPYAAEFARLTPKPGTWLLSHRPIWAIGQKFKLNQTLEQAVAASGGRLPHGIELVLSGHLHIFELLSFIDERPPQLVVGSGGTELDKKINRALDGTAIGDATVRHGRSEHRFGFLMITPQPGGSTATFFSPEGKPRFKCALTSTSVRCD
jgi:Calcineurin-like phosphoesterase